MATEPQTASSDDSTPEQRTTLTGIVAKYHHIQTHVTEVQKSGYNAHHKFNFIEEHKLIELLRPSLRALGVALVPHPAEELAVDGDRRIIRGTIDLIDLETGEKLTLGPFIGEAGDKQDKASPKAQTIWMKYALQKAFLIPTQGIADGDADGQEPAAAPQQAPATGQAPAPADGAGPLGLARATQMIDRIAERVSAGQLDGNKVQAKLASYRVDLTYEGAAQLTELAAADFWAWCEKETAKSQAAAG